MNILPQNREQFLMFNSIDDFIPVNSPIRFLEILIEHIITENKNKYLAKGESLTGRPAYSAETMLKIYLYGYLNRITSSRRLENECNRNLEMIWLTGNLRPDFKTIADFRKDNPTIIEQFAKDLRKLIKSFGLFDTKTIIIDSTKLKANASKKLDRRDDIVKRLFECKIEFENYIKEINNNDNIIDDDDEKILLEKKSNLLNEIKVLEAKIKKMDETHKNYISNTDPNCYLVQKYGSYFTAYHLQVLTDPKYNFIVSEYLSNYNHDSYELPISIEVIKEEYKELPEEIIADAGYRNFDIINDIEEKLSIECIVAHKDKKKNSVINFTYDKTKDVMICSEGKELKLHQKNKTSQASRVNEYLGTECLDCRMKEQCTKSKVGRNVTRYWNQEFRDNHKERMKTSINKQKFNKRKSSVEHIFGTIKQWLGYMPILTRGREKVTTEIKLISSAYNIKRLMNIITIEELREKLSEVRNHNIRFKNAVS